MTPRLSRLATAALLCSALCTGGIANAAADQGSVAVTRISNSGIPGNGGSWASDQVTRTAVLSGGFPAPPSRCGKASGPCYGFAATVTDQGTFRASAGALTPNQSVPGKHIAGLVTGTVNGTGFFGTFYATARPDAGLVPRWAVNAFYVTSWPAQFFPAGTIITGLQLTGWSERYGAWTGCGAQQWTDSSANGYGDLPRDGNILGCPHPR